MPLRPPVSRPAATRVSKALRGERVVTANMARALSAFSYNSTEAKPLAICARRRLNPPRFVSDAARAGKAASRLTRPGEAVQSYIAGTIQRHCGRSDGAAKEFSSNANSSTYSAGQAGPIKLLAMDEQ